MSLSFFLQWVLSRFFLPRCVLSLARLFLLFCLARLLLLSRLVQLCVASFTLLLLRFILLFLTLGSVACRFHMCVIWITSGPICRILGSVTVRLFCIGLVGNPSLLQFLLSSMASWPLVSVGPLLFSRSLQYFIYRLRQWFLYSSEFWQLLMGQ